MTDRKVTRRLIHGAGANVLSQSVKVVTQLVTLPIFISVWGTEKYGEWLVLSSLATFLSMSDIGFATAAVNEMTMRVGRGDKANALKVYQNIWVLLTVLSGIILAVVLAILWLTPAIRLMPLEATTERTGIAVLSILAIHILVGQQLGVQQAGFRCDGNYALGQILMTGNRVAETTCQVLAAFLTSSMIAVAAFGLLARVISALAISVVLRRRSPWLRFGLSNLDFTVVRELGGAATAFLAMPLGHAFGNQGMIQVVGLTLGPAEVAVFAAHRTVANLAIQFMTIINNSVWPEISAAYGANDVSLMKKLHRISCRTSLWLCWPLCLVILLLAPFVIPLWTAHKIAVSLPLLIAFLSVVLLRSLWRSSSVVLLATNQHKRLSALFLLGNALACAIAVPASRFGGLAAVASCLACADLALGVTTTRASLRIVCDSLPAFLKFLLTFPISRFTAFRSVVDRQIDAKL